MKNNELATQSQAFSPFDVIRHFDENGSEFWKARKLMKMLGYTKWQQFGGEDTTPLKSGKPRLSLIDRAALACQNSGNNTGNHFTRVSKMVERPQGGSRRQDDWNLSRYACYLVAMNGDPNKPEIAAAQSYFAVKTREAEVVVPVQSERIKELELQLAIATKQDNMMNTQRYLTDKRETLVSLHGLNTAAWICGGDVVEVKEVINETVVIDASSGRNATFTGQSTAQVGKSLGFKSGKKFEEWLNKIGHGDLINQGMRAVQAPYIPQENIAEVKRLWQSLRGHTSRQLLIGE